MNKKFEVVCTVCGSVEITVSCVSRNGQLLSIGYCSGCKASDTIAQHANLAHRAPFIMPFGKYKGRSVDEIVDEDSGYARWAAQNLENENIRQIFEEALS
jgi:formylmethanofuran dehydrogenase subunit B